MSLLTCRFLSSAEACHLTCSKPRKSVGSCQGIVPCYWQLWQRMHRQVEPNEFEARRVQLDLTRVELEEVLPSATIMVVTVTASTTAGQPLSETGIAAVHAPPTLIRDPVAVT